MGLEQISKSEQSIAEFIASQPGVGSSLGGGVFTPDAFNQLITDSSSFSVTLDSGTRNAIQWITAKDRILIGTADAEWRMSGHSNKPLTPSNFDLKKQTVWGSKDMQPLVLHEAVLFVDFVGRKLRELVWDGIEERYTSPDLMLLAEHITLSGGITTMAYQKNPDSIIWATLANGDLISCTYDKLQKVVAWARHPISMGSEVGTGTVIPSEGTTTPLVYPTLQTTTAQDDPQLPHVTAISNVEELQNMSSDMTGNYYLTGDIDLSGIDGAGWIPIGLSGVANGFKGTFDGQGYTISNLYINRNSNAQALFGYVYPTAKIANVTLSDVDITGGSSYVAALVGFALSSEVGDILIQNCHSSGTLTSYAAVMGYYGGLIGNAARQGGQSSGTVIIYDSDSSCILDMSNATSGAYRGGFAGWLGVTTVSNCFATGNLTGGDGGDEQMGGFAGNTTIGSYSFCYATGSVSGAKEQCGGFAGQIGADTSFNSCYATGNASGAVGGVGVGGFAGAATSAGDPITFADCYAWGNAVSGGTVSGGFVGSSPTLNTTFDNCYSIGVPSGTAELGGFAGAMHVSAVVVNIYWDTETSGLDTTDGDVGEGQTTSWLKTKSNYPSTWDFDDTWEMAGGVPWLDSTNSNNMGANSVTVIPGSTEDEVWATITRVIDDAIVRYVERMKPRNFGTDLADAFFVDSGLTYDGDPATVFSGLDHLEGETVAILGDGAVFPTQTVTNGSVTLSESVSVCQIGLPFTYKVKPMRMDQATSRGTTKGSIKKIYSVVVSFYKTLNAKYGNGRITSEFKFPPLTTYSTPAELFTGDRDATLDGGYDVEDPIEITGSDPMPCTVRAIIPRLDVTGK